MANRWKIPHVLEAEVTARDTACVYCGVVFVAEQLSRRDKPSWEHIVNDARLITRENIARCCLGCNASKGAKLLAVWLESSYCKSRGITRESVAVVVQAALVGAQVSHVGTQPLPQADT